MRVGKNKGGKKKEKFDMAACARFLDVFINKTYKVVKKKGLQMAGTARYLHVFPKNT